MDNLLFKSGNSGQVNIDEAQGIVECFVAGIGNKDSVGDVVISGAFAKSLTRRKPRVVWGHSWNDPIGKVLEMYEVPVGDSRLPVKMRSAGIGGLYAKVQFNLNSEKGKEAFATVAFFGEEQEWSIGYKTIDSVFDPNLQANILKEVELYEVSPVLHGANQLTGTISIKGDEKGHMPIIPMSGMGMQMMPEMPRIVVIASPQEEENGASESNPFDEGMAQELRQPDKMALQAELTERTGSKIEVMNATENSVVFRRTTADGKASMYRLPYHKEGNQYMFGKPEPYAATNPVPQAMQNVEQKPGAPVVVPNGGIAYRTDDQAEMAMLFAGENAVQSPWGKSDVSHLIELPESYMASAKEFISPVLRHHKLQARPNAKGIIIDGLLTANALDALQNAVKALGTTIGQAGGNIGQAIGRIRDLAQTFNPYALDGDGDGFVQDGGPFQRPYVPIKKPGFDLPDVRGKKRSGDALLDKPRSAPKLPKDRNTWTRAQRNEALLAGVIEPETRDDVAFLANKRPDNEGIAKYWDMSEADLTKEGNRLVNARRQATGAEKDKIDQELLKVSHEFQRRAAYAETFGQDFVPPAKREKPNLDLVPVDITQNESIGRMLGAPKPKRTQKEGLASAGKVFDSLNETNLEERNQFLDWDELEEDDQLEFMQEIEYDYMYDEHSSLGDDGIVDALENGEYEDEIREYAEELYDKIKADRIKKREEEDAKNEREENERYAQSDAGRAEAAEEERQAREDAADYEREKEQEEELRRRARDRALDEQADAALDRAIEGYIEKYGEDEPLPQERGLGSRGERSRIMDASYFPERDGVPTFELPLAREEDFMAVPFRDGEFGSNEKDSAAAKIFDSILEKYWKMWGFDVPDEDEAGWDEPFGFASRGNDEEVQQSKLDELVGGVKDRLIAELETADPSTWKPSWRNDSLPINPTTGKPYRGWNAFFLMLAAHDRKYNTGRFAGFNQLKARGAIVRKGEKGTPILRPQLVKKEDEDGNVKEFVVFRGATVFNIDQTEGGDEALRAIPADLPESERIAILDETLKELGVTVQTANMTPHYNPDGDYISMPDFAKGTSALEWTSTLAHEAVHWTGHKSRLDRASLRDYSSDKAVRAYEELVAEIGSAMLLAAHGIEAPFRQDHAPYIKGWIQLLKDDPEALNKAFKDAQAAVNFMLEKSPNLRRLFGGVDTGKKAPEVDAPDKVEALVGASEGFASLHRVRTPGSSALGGILYDDNSNELMVGFLKGKSWDDLSEGDRENWIERYRSARRGQGGYESPLDDTQLDERARDFYEDSRDIGWYVYSDVSMEEVSELAAARSKGRHINALKKLKKARKASDEDQFNFFGRDERVQDVKKSDGFASVGTMMHPSYTRDSVAQWWLIARSEGARGRQGGSKQYLVRIEKLPDGRYVVKKYFGKDENQPIGRLQSTMEGPFRDYAVAKQVGAAAARAKMPKYLLMYDNIPARDDGDGFASGMDLRDVNDEQFLDYLLNRFDPGSGIPLNIGYSDDENRNYYGIRKRSEVVEDFRNLLTLSDSELQNALERTREYYSNISLSYAMREGTGTRGEKERMQAAGKRVAAIEAIIERRKPKAGGEDGFASRGAKKLGVESRYQDRDWINRTQERILKSGLDFQSLPENDRIDWANSFLDEYLNENEMGHNLADVANGRRLNTRPDIDLLNYAEQAYARMSDAHMARRAQFGRDEDGFASVGMRTMRVNIKPSKAVDYVSYDPDSESLYVAYKREDGRGDMYVYEGVSMDEAIGVGNAESVGKAINDIKRSKNVRKATPDEVMSLAESERYTNDRALPALRANKLSKIQQLIHGDSRFGLGARESRIDDDEGGRLILSERDDTRLVADWNPANGEYEAYIERYDHGGREEPGEWVRDNSTASKPFLDDSNHSAMLDELLRLNGERELALDSDRRVEREIETARRELDMAGDAPGVESVDVTYSSALDAVDYNPSTQELRVTYKGGGTYVYEGVDRITFEEFKYSPSKGRAMNDIKRAHPYRKDSEWTGGGDEDGGIEEFDVRGSAAVEKVTYDPSKEELTVVYSGGKGYIYSGVTREEADAVRSAPSKGRAINDVKRTHDVRKIPTEVKGGPDLEATGWSKGDDGKWRKGVFSIVVLRDEEGNYKGLLATHERDGTKYQQEAHPDVSANDHLEDFEGILRGVGNLDDDDETISIDPAPAPKPRVPTRKPPRGGKRVRNRSVVIDMEQGTLDEIIEAEGKNITVDALRDAAGSPMGKYTKGPRKGKNRGYDTITVRDAETGELLHANEILLTSSASPGSPSAANRKRGYIRARSYAGRQGHNVVSDEGPNLRGEGRGMTDYDKRVYGLGSDERNRAAGLASYGGGDFTREEEELMRKIRRAEMAALEAPVVRGEKSPLLGAKRIEFDGFGDGGAAHIRRSERTYDINGPVSMPIWQFDAVQRTKFADQIVKDWSRSDLTVDELAERFNITPLQVQDVLEDAAARIRHGETIAPRDLESWSSYDVNGLNADAKEHKRIAERASELFVGDRKHTDIPEPTDEVRKLRAPREERARKFQEWAEASKKREIALRDVRRSPEYRNASKNRNEIITAIRNAEDKILVDERLNGLPEGDPAFDSPGENIRVFDEAMTGSEISEVLSMTGIQHRNIDDAFETDYNGDYYYDGERVDIDELEPEWFGVDTDALTDEQRKDLVSAIAVYRKGIKAKANKARGMLGLSPDASHEEARKAADGAIGDIRDRASEMVREVEANNPVPRQPELRRRTSGLLGVTDENGKYIDTEKPREGGGFASRGGSSDITDNDIAAFDNLSPREQAARIDRADGKTDDEKYENAIRDYADEWQWGLTDLGGDEDDLDFLTQLEQERLEQEGDSEEERIDDIDRIRMVDDMGDEGEDGFASGRRRPNQNNAGFTPLDDEYWKPLGRSGKVLFGQDTNNDFDWTITAEDDGSYMVEIVGPEGNEGLLGAAGGDSEEYFDTLDEAKQFVYDFDPDDYFRNDGQPTDSDIFYEQEDWGFASRGRGAGMQNFDARDYETSAAREIRKDLMGRANQNLGREIVMMDDGNGNMVPTAVHWGSRPNSKGESAPNDWVFDFAPKGEWMEVGVGDSSAVKRVWIKRNNTIGGPGRGTGNDSGYFGNEVMVMFNNGRIYAYDDVTRPDLIGLLDAESMGRAVREITHPDGEAREDFKRIGSLAEALKMVRQSYSGDRGEDGYFTEYPRGEEDSYKDYVAKVYEEADAALEWDKNDYEESVRALVEEGRIMGGPGDSGDEVMRAHRQSYLDNFGLTRDEWENARPSEGLASRAEDSGDSDLKRKLQARLDDMISRQQEVDTSTPEGMREWENLEESIGILTDRIIDMGGWQAARDDDGFASRGAGIRFAYGIDDAGKQEILDSLTPEELDFFTPSEFDDFEWEVRRNADGLIEWESGSEDFQRLADTGERGDQDVWVKITKRPDGKYELIWDRQEITRSFGGSYDEPGEVETESVDGGRGVFDTPEEAVMQITLPGGGGFASRGRSSTKPTVDADTQREIEGATLGQLAQMIQDDLDEQGKEMYFGAVPYVEAMATLETMDDKYGYDDAESIVAYALGNLQTYKGPKARAIKAELKKRLDEKFKRNVRSGGFASRGRALDWEETESGSGVWNAVGNNPTRLRGDSIYTITRDEDGKFGVDAAHGYSYQRDGGTDYDEEYFDEVFDTLDEAKDFVRRIDDSREGEGDDLTRTDDDGFASRGVFMDDGIRLMRRGNRDFLSDEFSSREYRDAMSGLDKVRNNSGTELTTEESRAIRKLADLYLQSPATRGTQREAINDIVNMVNDYRLGRGSRGGFASRGYDGEKLVSYEGGVGEPAYADVLSNFIVKNINDDTGPSDWIREVIATEYLPNTEPGSDESNILKGILDGDGLKEEDYAKLPETLLDEIDEWGNSSGEYFEHLAERERNNRAAQWSSYRDYQRDRDYRRGFRSRGDDGFASRGSKYVSSNGTRVNPARMHEDDRLALSNVTDPEERKKYIDRLLEFYGNRIVAKPSSRRSQQRNADGLASRGGDDDRYPPFSPFSRGGRMGTVQASGKFETDYSDDDALDELNGNSSDSTIQDKLMDAMEGRTYHEYGDISLPSDTELYMSNDAQPYRIAYIGNPDNVDEHAMYIVPIRNSDDRVTGAAVVKVYGEVDGDSDEYGNMVGGRFVYADVVGEYGSMFEARKAVSDHFRAGFASRGGGLSPERERVADAQNEVDRLTRLFGSIYGETFEEDGQMELNDLIDQEMRKQRIGRREATKFARELQKDYLTYSDARNELDDAIIAEEESDMDGERQFANGFASRGRLRTAEDREDLLVELSNYPDDYDADMANMAAQDLQNNFARLSADDQNMYFQRALTNNAESGMTAEQILEEAKKLAMDDRRLAELERQSIGEGQSSKPRKIDVSSSSALNSVEYDEMNRRLSVEYRGRDGKGTGTLYTYDGVEPDVVDRIEAADSRGATMREVRDNYEFTTSRKLPESAYEGLASRGGSENISIERGRNGQWVMSAMVTGNRGANEENRGTRRMQYTVVGGSRRDALKAFRDWMDENNVSFDGGDGFASRGGRRSTREMEIEFTSLEESDSALGRMNPSEVQEYRQKLIDARNQAALEMIQAAGLDPKKIRYADDVTTDEDDFGILERYDMAISDADEHLGRHRRDKSIAEAKQNAAARALGAAQDVAKEVRDGSSERRRSWDSDEEYIQALREDWDSILGVVDTFVSDESEGESLDSMETYTLEHDTYVFDEERQMLDGMQARIDSAKTEDDFAQIQTDLENIMDGLVKSHEDRYREDEAYNDYEAPYVPDEDELPSSSLTDFLKNENVDGFASRGSRRRPGRRNQGRKRQGMAPKTRYTDEERQAIADGNVLKSRRRPGKRREGPSASEWDGFASTGLDETYSDMPTDRNVVFEGGEHGPGKDISLNKMWENYRSTLPSLAPRRGSRKQPDKWSMTEPLYDQRDELDPETGLTKKVRRLLVAPATFDEFMERFGPDSSVGLDEASVRALMDSRIPGSPEMFIDDPYLADKISTALGYGVGKNEGLFGFDPLKYYDEAGTPATDVDKIDAAIASERARRTARLAAREGRLGKRNVIQRRPTQAAGDNRPVGEISLRDLAQKLSEATGRNIALTDDEGNALSPERMRRNLSDAGIDLPWSIQKFRVMKQRQVLPYEYAKDLVNLGILGESDLPERDALTLGEIAQWPGFRESGLNAASVYRALAEVGISLEPRNARSIEEAFGYAGRGERRRIASRNLRRGSVLVSKAKVREMMERLGLDADEFEKWFSRTDNFTDVPNRPEVTP